MLVFLLACSTGSPTKIGTTPTDASPDSRAPESSPTDSSPPESDPTSESPPDSPADTDPWTLPARPDTDHPTLTDSWRYGGGSGYPDVVDPTWPVVTRVQDLTELISALNTAQPGDIVFVEEDAQIDLTGTSLCVNTGVWLASSRGQGTQAGGLLYSTEGASTSILKACGENARITGLRIRGPDPETCPPEWPNSCPEDVSGDSNCAYCTQTAYGISTFGYAGLEVDNNELSGWTYAAVGVKDALQADIHHNHIHHSWREGLGYGVVLYGQQPTTALIRWNRFDAMRHVVAGQGYPGEDYEARDNLMGENAISHVYDMHGQDEVTGDGSSYAGGDIRIHANIILPQDQYALAIRGKPDDGAWFYNNCLARSESNAEKQLYFYGNYYIDTDPTGTSAPNQYDQSPSDCGTLHWCIADHATSPIRYGSATGTPARDLKVGDLDGDGKDDVFGTDGSRWRFANPNGGSWSSLASSGMDVEKLQLADLDGDGIDDVFYASGSSWQWSKSGSASWATLKTTTETEVGFGDFDGDGKMDAFTTDGSRWYYHPGGSGAAIGLATSGNTLSTLAFGDFDGDGVTDIFTGDGTQWKWSQSGAASWANLASSSAGVSELGFADVDGDGVTDVLNVSSETLRYSSGGRTSWVILRYQREGLGDIRLGDFDGDGAADILTGECL